MPEDPFPGRPVEANLCGLSAFERIARYIESLCLVFLKVSHGLDSVEGCEMLESESAPANTETLQFDRPSFPHTTQIT